MRLVRVRRPDGPRWGWYEADRVAIAEGDFASGFVRTGQTLPFDASTLLAPVAATKIVALAASYPKHAAEMGNQVPDEPRIFLKPLSAVIDPGAPILIPPRTTRVDPECEIAMVLGRRLSRATPTDALASVFGYTCLNDVTARDFQKKDRIFGRAKGFDSFCPVGPWIETALDPHDVAVQTRVNGDLRASGRTSDLFWPLADILAFVSGIMTLEPGDIVTTGTPPGVAPIQDGDRVEVEVEGIGVLTNPVRNRSDRR